MSSDSHDVSEAAMAGSAEKAVIVADRDGLTRLAMEIVDKEEDSGRVAGCSRGED